MKRGRRLSIWIGAGLLGILVGLLFVNGSRNASSEDALQPPDGAPIPLTNAVRSTDLLARVTSPVLFSSEEFDFGIIMTHEMSVVDVLFVSQSAANQIAEPGRPYVVPDVRVGDELLLGSSRQSGFASRHQFDSAGSEVYVSATYFPDHRLNGHKTNWLVNYVASADADGRWTFHNPSGDGWRRQFDRVHASISTELSDAELMVQWVQEGELHRVDGTPSPLFDVFSEARVAAERQSAADARWLGLDPRQRGLDPELTPSEVLDTLAVVQLLVDIESVPADQRGQSLMVLTDTGVVHSAWLSAGNHAVDVLAKPGDAWRIVLNHHETGEDVTVGTVAANDWLKADTTDHAFAVLIEYSGGTEALASLIDLSASRTLLQGWAEADAAADTE